MSRTSVPDVILRFMVNGEIRHKYSKIFSVFLNIYSSKEVLHHLDFFIF